MDAFARHNCFNNLTLCTLGDICLSRVLAALMVSVSNLVSTRLRDALISRAECLLDTVDPLNYNTPRRMVQFLRSIKCIHRPLLEKCNEIFMRNIPRLDAENISIILGLYQSLQFNNCDFRLAAKERLIELIDTSTDPYSFSKLFVALAPISSAEIRERLALLSRSYTSIQFDVFATLFCVFPLRLENTTLLVADEFSAHQALAVVEALEEIQSRNFSLLNK